MGTETIWETDEKEIDNGDNRGDKEEGRGGWAVGKSYDSMPVKVGVDFVVTVTPRKTQRKKEDLEVGINNVVATKNAPRSMAANLVSLSIHL